MTVFFVCNAVTGHYWTGSMDEHAFTLDRNKALLFEYGEDAVRHIRNRPQLKVMYSKFEPPADANWYKRGS